MPTETRGRCKRSAADAEGGPPQKKSQGGARELPKKGKEGRGVLRDTTNNSVDDRSATHSEARCGDSLAQRRTRRRSSRLGVAARDLFSAANAAAGPATDAAEKTTCGGDVEAPQSDSVGWLRTRPKRSFGHASSRCRSSYLLPSDTKRSKASETTDEVLGTPLRAQSNDYVETTSARDGPDDEGSEALQNPSTGVSPAPHKAESDDAEQAVSSGDVSRGDDNYAMRPANFNLCRYTVGVAPYDEQSEGNVLAVPDYVADIFQRLHHCEREIGPLKRAILMGWMVFVQSRCHLLQESLHLAYDLVDRYLSIASVPGSRLQLLGAASLLIASKYEEIFPARVIDLVSLSDRAYTRTQVMDMESEILFAIHFRVSNPTSYSFLGRFLFLIDAGETTAFAASYYLELALQDADVLVHQPSLVALAVTCLAINQPDVRERDGLEIALPGVVRFRLCALQRDVALLSLTVHETRFDQPRILTSYSGYSRECVSSVARQVARFFASRRESYFDDVGKKYKSKWYGGVAKFNLPTTFVDDATEGTART